jgi:hypothetical protein
MHRRDPRQALIAGVQRGGHGGKPRHVIYMLLVLQCQAKYDLSPITAGRTHEAAAPNRHLIVMPKAYIQLA